MIPSFGNAKSLAIAAGVAGLAASLAFAQSPAFRIRGRIAAVDGPVLTITTREGPQVKLRLADDVKIGATVKASLADVGPNSYVGTAALPQADGTLKALEVHVFPEAQRGAGEGFRDFDLAPGSTMTNATVSGQVTATADGGRTLRLVYKDGEKTVVVPPDAPVVTFAAGTPADVKAGAGIIVFAAEPVGDGTFKAARITVGRDGVDPPM